jgi:RimJ/RimL family protein N-acetyltransferase
LGVESRAFRAEVVRMIALGADAPGQVRLARLERSDGKALRRLFYRLSPETIYRRFHSPLVRPEQAQPERLLDIDHHEREAVVAVVDGEIVGVARYFRQSGTDAAEVAVVVADDWHRQGVATRMFGRLVEFARAAGIDRFTVSMQADNTAALALFRRFNGSGATLSQGILESTVPIWEGASQG